MDYWRECIAEAFEDANITATEEQIATVASWAEGAHDNYSQAHGHDCIPNPLRSKVDKLESELREERRKIQCKECRGTGVIVSYGPCHSSSSPCYICRGEGRHLPGA
jgi:DnaJ-class molecular chaperone